MKYDLENLTDNKCKHMLLPFIMLVVYCFNLLSRFVLCNLNNILASLERPLSKWKISIDNKRSAMYRSVHKVL